VPDRETSRGGRDGGPLAGLAAPFVLLEDRLNRAAPAWLYRDPIGIVRCNRSEALDAAFAALDAGLSRGLHAAGFLSYELGYALEPALAGLTPPVRDTPLMWFGLFQAPRPVDARALDRAFAEAPPAEPITNLEFGHDRDAHAARTQEILRLIRAGDVYQVNLTFPVSFRFGGSPLSLYAALRVRQPVAHGALIALADRTILSVSPELFVEVRDGQATTRPMKGTTARGADPLADAAAREGLAADPKQRAENLMIVDLLRNDLARVSLPGGVSTPTLFVVETYPTFHAMTSTVSARLAPHTGLRERMAALFPCGSVVGAPKIRAAEVIAALEAEPRGVYTGAIGVIRPGGDMAFNVAIRTATLTAGGVGRYGVGGGVVADSDPDAEYDEALLKARALVGLAADFGLIETFRWSAEQGFVRMQAHLGRLAASAERLGFEFSGAALAGELAQRAQAWDPRDRRVRVALSRSGAFEIVAQPLDASPERPLRVALATACLDAADPFLRHKTTRRERHEQAFAEAVAKGLDEALLLNRDGAVADGSRNSLFLQRDGRLLTPPLGAGALPGVLRAGLIASGQAVEAELAPADFRCAQGWFLGNSLHGLRPARLVDRP